MAKEDKLKALDAAISQIEKQYGKGSIMKLGDPSTSMNVETVPTGALSLDDSWDEYVATLESMGAGQLMEIYQAAYDAGISAE